MKSELPKYKKRIESLTVENMIQEREDEKLAAKWKELNMGIEQWKHKYLFPFGAILPISDQEYQKKLAASQTSQYQSIPAQGQSNDFLA